MGAAAPASSVIALSEGLSLVPCTIISLSFIRADVSVKPVDEWQLKEALTTVLNKRLGLAISDRDLVVHREKNYYKKRRDEPIADGVLHLWGAQSEGEKTTMRETDDLGKYVVENVNGLELNVGGLKLKCLTKAQETNNYESIRRSWEAIFGPPLKGKLNSGPTTLTLKGVPSRWFAEPRVSSKASVLVTHTIFSKFGEIRNLEVLGNEDMSKASIEVGSMASALQCQVWVQFDNHASFCHAMHSLCGHAMQKEGSSFRATYLVDWDKENYFSLMNVRRRKFEKERLEQQERRDAERAQKQELQARQEEVARVEEARLRMEQMVAALREEEEREQQLAEEAQRLTSHGQESNPESASASEEEEEGLIADERQESSDEELVEQEQDEERYPQKENLQKEPDQEERSPSEEHDQYKSPERKLSSSLERWQPEEELEYPRLEIRSYRRKEDVYPSSKERTAQGKHAYYKDLEEDAGEQEKVLEDRGKRSHYSYQDEEEEQEKTVEARRGEEWNGGYEVERWVLEATHSVASLSASEMLSVRRLQSPEKRLRSVILTNS